MMRAVAEWIDWAIEIRPRSVLAGTTDSCSRGRHPARALRLRSASWTHRISETFCLHNHRMDMRSWTALHIVLVIIAGDVTPAASQDDADKTASLQWATGRLPADEAEDL